VTVEDAAGQEYDHDFEAPPGHLAGPFEYAGGGIVTREDEIEI
jgi:hypothetical protein